MANSHFSKTRASGKERVAGRSRRRERVHEGVGRVGWGWEVWCNRRWTGDPEGKGIGETDVEGERNTSRETRKRGGAGRILVPLTHRSRSLPPFSGRHCPSPGAEEAVKTIGPGGSRCRGHCLREASQGCSAVHDAGSGAAHRTGEDGEAPGRCRHNKKPLPSHPGDAPALPSHLPSCLHRAVRVGLKAPSSSFHSDPGL